MHPSPGARLPDLILTYFVYSTLFDNVICLLPADTDRSVRNSFPSILFEPSCQNSVSCPSKSSASIVLDFVCATPFDIAICLLPADTNCSFRNFVPSIPSEPNRRISVCCHSITSALILVNFVCVTPSDNVIRLLPADTNRYARNSVPSIPSESSSRISVCCLSNASAPILMNFVCANQCDPISYCYSPSRS
jgi:hypothetical protein